ncbi:MFS domain-containing protein [Caerostris darwini]|uniref:MFS domain-containing protein n=1 Tax=Caerostris darwini TaxID=1538125 RepID=A0AAV4NNT8_9ARAC|nr:MFS domain-containing protein [Caerostris darwini]
MATNGADSGWSWVIAASCCWITFVIQGLVRSGGVIYVALIDGYSVSRSQASWPFTLRLALWNLTGPLAGALSYRWSIRAITLFGVLVVTVTYVICWFVSDMVLVTLFLGGIQGMGVGLAVTLVPVMINQYFKKYKTTGAGIACAGATVGSFALPPLVEFTLEEFGLKGAFLMMAGITLHGVLGAALLRPAEWLTKKTIVNNNNNRNLNGHERKSDQNLNFLTKNAPEVEEIKTLLNGGSNTKAPKATKAVRFSCNEELCREMNHADERDNLIEDSSNAQIIQRQEKTGQSVKTTKEIDSKSNHGQNGGCSEFLLDANEYRSNETPLQATEEVMSDGEVELHHYGRLQFIDNKTEYDPRINLQTIYVPSNSNVYGSQDPSHIKLTPVKVSNGGHSYSPHETERKWWTGLMEPARAACEIVKNPMFIIISSNYSIFFLSYMTYLIVIVDYSLDLGIERTDCVFLVSTFSIADLAGRLGSGWITDSGIVKRKHLMMLNMVCFGALLAATSLTSTYMAVTAVSVSAGLIVGINLILFYALLEEYLGLTKLPMAIGLMNFSIGIISLVTPLLTGYFRDTMGSYDHLFHLLGGVSVFCGLLWAFEPVIMGNKRKNSLEKEIPA